MKDKKWPFKTFKKYEIVSRCRKFDKDECIDITHDCTKSEKGSNCEYHMEAEFYDKKEAMEAFRTHYASPCVEFDGRISVTEYWLDEVTAIGEDMETEEDSIDSETIMWSEMVLKAV